MKHLTDDQLSARLDGELGAKPAEAVESHLAACAACRERLAALAGADASLASALERDPGEKYFASFAERVQARIAASATAAAPRPAHAETPAPGRAGWFNRPSALAWVGTAAVLVVAGTFAVQFATHEVAGGRGAAKSLSLLGADRRESRDAAPGSPAPAAEAPAPTAAAPAPALMQAPADGGTDALSARPEADRQRFADERRDAPAPGAKNEALLEKQRATSADAKAQSRENAPAAPQRLQEVRTLPNSEQVPAAPRALPQAGTQKAFAPPPAEQAKVPKPAAQSLAPVTTEKRASATPEPNARGGRADESKLAPPATAAVPAPTPPVAAGNVTQPDESASGAALADRAEAPATVQTCGKVTDAAGRALAHATVTVVETGHSVSTDADGSYCVEAPAGRATLSVLSVGFHEYRASIRPGEKEGPLAVVLRPVPTLGTSEALAARLKALSPPVTQGEKEVTVQAERGLVAKDQATAGKPATIAPLPGETPDAKAAREASEAAMRTRTVPLWSKAGALWEGVAAAAKSETALAEARFRAAEARMNAWRLARDNANRSAAAQAIEACLAKAPAGARRDSVEKWGKELPAR